MNPNGPRWLMSRGEGERSVAIMKRIAKMNKKEVCECKCCHHLRLNFHKVRPQKNTGLFGKFSQIADPRPPPLLETLCSKQKKLGD